MVLELYVFGPAFGLPSIDPQCLATIAFFVQAVPPHEWVLVASSDSTANPAKGLPVLHDDARWIRGFQSICHHLRQKSIPLSLDQDSHGAREKADIIAFSSLVEYRGQPLLDLSLYLSTENYHSLTRPAYSHLLSWPYQWFVPTQHRAAAKRRTEHLNLSSLDFDTGPNEQETPSLGSKLIPDSLRTSQQTISSLLTQPQHASRFRLEALAQDFLDPLQELLGDKPYMISDQRLSTLDCLAFAYLALALIPNVPQSWLADLIKSRYPTLCTYVKKLTRELFDSRHDGESPSSNVQLDNSTTSKQDTLPRPSLPWTTPQKYQPLTSSIHLILSSIPAIADLYNPPILKPPQSPPINPVTPPPFSEPPLLFSTTLAALGIGLGLAAASGCVLYSSDAIRDLFARRRGSSAPPSRPLSEMGEAGSVLSTVGLGEKGLGGKWGRGGL